MHPSGALALDEKVPYRRFVFWLTVDYLNRLMEDAQVYGYLMQLVRTQEEYSISPKEWQDTALKESSFAR